MNIEILKEFSQSIDNLYLYWNICIAYYYKIYYKTFEEYEKQKKSTDEKIKEFKEIERKNIKENIKVDFIKNIEKDLKKRFDEILLQYFNYLKQQYVNELKNEHKDYDDNKVYEKFYNNFDNNFKIEDFSNFLKKYTNKILENDNINDVLVKLENTQKNMIKLYETQNYKFKCLKLTTLERVVIGTGNPHFFEVGFSLHHLFGIPYIPASELKGFTRFYYKLEKGLNDDSEEISSIFGNENNKGSIIFLDAFLADIKNNPFELDIMNPHYDEYYNNKGQNPPADYLNPKPIFFITLKKGVSFKTYIISKDELLLNNVINIMNKKFSNIGIGAKTSVGYGRFNLEECK